MRGIRSSTGSRGSGAQGFGPNLLPGLVAAIGLWLSFGAVSPVAASSLNRVGALPSFWLLAACLVVVPALTLVLDPSRARVLYFGAVALLPWIPGRVAAFLVWQGPILCAFWIGTLLVLIWPSLAAIGSRVAAWTPSRQRGLAIAIATTIYVCAAWRMAPVLPGGDEPHYLIITQSLLKDADLRIENNHQQRDYRAYTTQELKPDYLRRGRNGAIYSIHAPGLPAVVAPAFALAGYAGVNVFLGFVCALGAALVWHASWCLTNDASAAWFGWASVALTTPFVFQAFTVYPDGLGAVLVMTAIVALIDSDRLSSSLKTAVHGAALALLPWLHTRYALVAVVLGGAIALRLVTKSDRRFSRVLAFVAVPVASATCWFLSFYLIYGTFNPAAPYGGYTQSSLANAARGLTGLLIDQQFGVLPNAPVYLAGLTGLWLLARIHRRLGMELTAVIVPYATAVACYQMWWGGHSSPGRFIVPILVVFGLPCAVFWQFARGPLWRFLLVTMLAASIGLALALAWSGRGALVYNFRDGISLWVEAATPIANLPLALPSLFRGSIGDAWTIGFAWLALAAAVVALAIAAFRGLVLSPETVRAVLAPAVVVAVVTLGPAAGWTASRAQAVDVGNGLWRVADDLSRGRVALQTLPPGWPDGSAALRELLIPGVTHKHRPPDSQTFFATSVPSGDYQLVGDSGLRVTGSVAMSVGRGSPPLVTAMLQEAPSDSLLALHLPAGAQELTVSLDRQARRDAGSLFIRPVQVWNSTLPLARRARTYGELRAWVDDEKTILEGDGFWTIGQGKTQVVLSADAPHDLLLKLRNGPVSNRAIATVSLLVNGSEREFAPAQMVALEPGAEKEIDLGQVFSPRSTVFSSQAYSAIRNPQSELRASVLLSIESSEGFRPADVDPKSTDQRMLGVWASLR